MRINLLLICLCFFCVGQAQQHLKGAYEEFPYSHVLKINLLSPVIGTINIHYEQKHDENASSQFELFYFTGQYFDQQIGVKGFGLTYNYRYYLTGQFPNGWYAQPFVRYQQYWSDDPSLYSSFHSNDQKMRTMGAGMVFGYQYVFKKRIAWDLYGGPMYNKSYINEKVSNAAYTGPIFNGGFVRMGTTVGFIF
jgi:hypothetical protein